MNKRASTQIQWTHIANGVRRAIEQGELRPGERLASETELAAQWNVSTMTAHRAMQELQREGWVTRKRRAGTVVADRSALPTRRIALIFSNLAAMPEAAYARGVRDALPENAQIVHQDIRYESEREAACLKRLDAADNVDGIVCYATCDPENTPLWVNLARKTPVVFVDRFPAGMEPSGVSFDAVLTDNESSVRSGLELLYRRGHTRIACFTEDSTPFLSSASERLAGYREFMERHYPGAPERWVRRLSRTQPLDPYYARVQDYIEEMRRGPEPITAVLCQEDKLLAAVLEAALRLRIDIPHEMEILSFSDINPFLLPLSRSVSRIVQRVGEMGGMAARRLMMRLDDPNLPPQIMRLPADIHPSTLDGPRRPS